MIGQTLSHYRITAALGAGGMGEVYRATDTKLGRDVAIKVLPAEMANDAGRLERFPREAHLLAALNHPHIAAIHGLEEADGQPFLVLELVEGEDLKERLARGAIPVDEALEIAVQVAEALEEAHNTGIVHRDLKPANVKVTPDGKVKVLDFGLAKAWAGDSVEGKASSGSMSQSPTLAHSGTQAGVILGTAAYMSPEQARGKPVDKRGDVWAFGVLLWEMLTGRALFAGDTVTDIIAAVVKEEPDLDALPPATPSAVRRLIARCLRKDPRARLPDVGAARLDLQEVLAGATTGTGGDAPAAPEVRRLVRRGRIWAAITAVSIGIAAMFAVARWTAVPDSKPVTRFVVDAPEGWSFTNMNWPVPSPDGRHLVIRAVQDDPEDGVPSSMLWLRSLESLSARPLAGTEGAGFPFWSPDGRFVGFLAEREVRRLSIADGVVQTICALPAGYFGEAAWNEEGTILFGVKGDFGTSGLYTVVATGGEPKLVMEPDAARDEHFLEMRQFLPDGRRFGFAAFDRIGGVGGVGLGAYVGSLDDPGERHLLMPGIAQFWLASGHVFFSRDNTLFAQPLDVERVELRGEPVPIASPVAFRASGDVGYFGVSSGGTLAYLAGESQGRVQLTWVDRNGEPVGTVGKPGLYSQLTLSPDETRVALALRDDLWVMDVSRGVERRVTSDPAREVNPVWSPDGQELIFGRYGKTWDIFRIGLRTGATAAPLLESPGYDWPEEWTRDGETLLFVRFSSGGDSLWALPLAAGGCPSSWCRPRALGCGIRICLPTGAGWPTSPTSPEPGRSTSSPSGGPESQCSSRSEAARSPGGGPTEESCSTESSEGQ